MTEKRYIPPNFDPPQPRPDDSPPPWRAGALLSPQAAREAEWEGGERAELGFVRIFTLAVLGGAFVGLAVALATTLGVGAGALPFGVGRLLGGAIVALGYAAVVVTGGELFAANNLVVMAMAGGRISFWRLLGHWIVVFWGNMAGAVIVAVLTFAAEHYMLAERKVGLAALELAAGRIGAGFLQLMALGILGSVLLCLALWLAMAARGMAGAVTAVLLPVAAMFAMGFEHATANMYAVLAGLLVKADLSFLQMAGKTAADFAGLNWGGFFWQSLLPVALGNVIGGTVLVGLVYGFVRLRRE